MPAIQVFGRRTQPCGGIRHDVPSRPGPPDSPSLRDGLGRLASINNTASGAAGLVTSHAYTYNAQGQRSQAAREDGSVWGYGYDTYGQVTSGNRSWTAGGTAVAGQQFGYAFDAIGNRTSTTVNGRNATYSPNALNQYISRQVPGAVDVLGAASPTAQVTINNLAPDYVQQGGYFYKDLSVTNTAGPVEQSVDVLAFKGGAGAGGADVVSETQGNVYVPQTPESFTYDLDGNLTQDGRWTYTWDLENRLTGMTALTTAPAAAKLKLAFSYDWMGRRIRKQVYTWNSTTSAYNTTPTTNILFVYDGWNLLAELDANNSNATLRTYRWGQDLSGSLQGAGGVGGLLSINSVSGGTTTTYDACYDGNGNITGLVSAVDGSIGAQYEYGPFGELVRVSGSMSVSNPFKFSTKHIDTETGWIFYGGRYYNPGTGRWLSRDPIKERGGNNLYEFVGNRPIGRIDLLGLEQVTIVADAFIQPAFIVAPFASFNPFVIDPFAIWKGNGRTFDGDYTNSKVWHHIVIETASDKKAEITNEAGGGSAQVTFRIPGPGDEDPANNGDEGQFTIYGKAGAPAKATIWRSSRCITNVVIDASSPNPLEVWAPPVRYHYELRFDDSTKKVIYSGWHTNYPWHELRLSTGGGYQSPALGPTFTPADLFFWHTLKAQTIDY
jgi:RHS repeat-associated protein